MDTLEIEGRGPWKRSIGIDSDSTVLLADMSTTATKTKTHGYKPHGRPNKSNHARSARSSWSWFRIFCRTFGLKLLTLGWFRKSLAEPAKVAIRQDRRVATLRATIHILPVAAAITLVALNFRGLLYGPANYSVSVLQFVAKAHEMLMQASIAFVNFAYLRNSLLSDNNLPFGAIFAAFQVNNLSYLWSPEFWSALTSKCLHGTRKVKFAILVSSSILLAAAVGPSSAIAMIPRQTNFELYKWTYWFEASEFEIFPKRMTTENVLANCSVVNPSSVIEEWRCPSRRWQSLQPWLRNLARMQVDNPFAVPISTYQLADATSIAPMHLCLGDTYTQQCPGHAVLSTTPFFSIFSLADENSQFYGPTSTGALNPKFSVLFSSSLKQPYVASSCQPFNLTNSRDDFIAFPSASMMSQPLWLQTLTTSLTEPPIPHVDIWNAANGTSGSQVVWINSTRYNLDNTSIAAVVLSSSSCGDSCIAAYSCITRAVWADAAFNITQGPYVAYETIESTSFPQSLNDLSQWPLESIDISTDWAAFLTPRVFGTDETIVASLLFENTSAPDTGSVDVAGVENDPGYAVDTFLSSLISLGLSQHIWLEVNYDQPNTTVQKTWMPFVQVVRVPGLAYTADGYSIKIAIAILLVYCAFAVSHFIYTIISSVSSSAWDSMPELVALAVNSPPSDQLDHTGAGIEKMSTFRVPVGIRAVDDHLQLQFGVLQRRTSATAEQVRVNEEYS